LNFSLVIPSTRLQFFSLVATVLGLGEAGPSLTLSRFPFTSRNRCQRVFFFQPCPARRQMSFFPLVWTPSLSFIGSEETLPVPGLDNSPHFPLACTVGRAVVVHNLILHLCLFFFIIPNCSFSNPLGRGWTFPVGWVSFFFCVVDFLFFFFFFIFFPARSSYPRSIILFSHPPTPPSDPFVLCLFQSLP